MNDVMMEMPKYNCHKQVWALKIASIGLREDGGATIFPVEKQYDSFVVSADYMKKHNPQPGGYFVRYKDGTTHSFDVTAAVATVVVEAAFPENR